MTAPTDSYAARRRAHKGTRPGGRSARVRRDVLDAVLAELVDGGYDALTLPRVADRAGVALSTVHRRWGSKAALVRDLLSDVTDAQVPDPQGPDLRSELIELANAVAAMLRTPTALMLLRCAFVLPDDDLADLRERLWRERFAVAQQVVDRAIARGELPAGTDGWALVERIHAPIWMRLLITGLPLSGALIERYVDDAVAAAVRGEASHGGPASLPHAV